MGARADIRLASVSRSFGARSVLSKISLEVTAGQIVGLLGPSGAGKTTLVKLIAGADRPDTGEVWVAGERMPRLSLLPRIGYMAQSDALYLELSGRENLEFFGALYSLAGARLRERIAAAAELVGLAADLDRPAAEYSGGMRRRLSLAIALLHQPTVVILDEPTVGIDPALRIAIWRELRGYADGGAAVLVTTHVMDEAERCTRVCMLRDGRIIADDSPAALKHAAGAATIEEAFLSFSGAAA